MAEENESYVYLKNLARLRREIRDAFNELQADFDNLMLCPEVYGDDAKVSEEFEKHSQYDNETQDVLDDINRNIDSLEEIHGPLAPTSGDQSAYQSVEADVGQDATAYSGATQTAYPEAENTDFPAESHLVDASSPINGTESESQQTVTAAPYAFCMVKDPASKIPKFNGDPIKFEEWWLIFNHYVDKAPIEVCEKVRILKNSLTGDAADAVAHLRVRRESYPIIRDIIQSTFGDVKMARTALVNQVHNLCSKKDIASTGKFVQFVSQLAQNIRSLISYGHSFETLSVSFAPMILGAISNADRAEFNKE